MKFGHIGKQLDEKANVNFQNFDVTDWKTNSCNTSNPDTSSSKEKQALKFGQLIEYNTKNISLEKSCTKCDDGETCPRSFLKTEIEHISGLTDCSFLQFAFVVCPSLKLPKNTETKVLTTFFYFI